MKSAEHAITGSEDVNDHIDKVEWDVKLAEQEKSEWRFNFGKHSGETIKEVSNSDPSYISWLRKQDVVKDRGDLALALKEYDASNSWFSWGFSKAKPVEATSDATKPTVENISEVASAPAPDAWGVEAATEKNKHDASLATQLALAYAIHKSFIFVRVPITAAITPKVVQILRGWGWDIGKRTTKEAKALKRASMPVKKPKARWSGKPEPKAK
ncbi:hypothetical protein BDZ45DRAFT_685863 [Acephala macrosclerotiorum]|nr:hypothetical protein BDZ45DRAFT_685863 [Acephala macrosclerotiorum]